MLNKEKFIKRYNSMIYNHLWLKFTIEYGFSFLVTLFSAFIFAFGVNVFLQPNVLGATEIPTLVSGGSSGLAQVFDLIFRLFGVEIKSNESFIFSALYLAINVPLVIMAFKGIGKRFGTFTLLNVGLVFVFTNILRGPFLLEFARLIDNLGGTFARAFFAGICTGISSAFAYIIDASAGGFDVVSYYISMKKSTLAGKYSVIINAIIVVAFTILTVFQSGNSSADALAGALFSIVYLITVMLVIDLINVRNKKVQIQIITLNENLPSLLIANIPHGATLIDAKGVYTNTNRYIVYMVVSITEVRKAVKVIRQLDPEAFVNVTELQQVYGNFHTKTIK